MTVRYLEDLEPRRGCGFRATDKLYLIGEGMATDCHRFPLNVHVCPTCGEGIRPIRNVRWINPKALWGQCGLPNQGCHKFGTQCPACFPPEKAGVMGVGDKHYADPRDFITEAGRLGSVSKAINMIPKGLEVGVTWIYLVHPQAGGLHMDNPDPKGPPRVWKACPGVFYAFKPARIEMLVRKADATEEKLKELEERKVDAVIVPDDYEQKVQATEKALREKALKEAPKRKRKAMGAGKPVMVECPDTNGTGGSAHASTGPIAPEVPLPAERVKPSGVLLKALDALLGKKT